MTGALWSVSRRTAGAPLPIRAELTVDDRGRTADEAYFHARWNRETRARRGVPFPLLDVSGRGHLVGFTLHTAAFPVYFAVLSLASVAVATASWYGFERPINALKRYFPAR